MDKSRVVVVPCGTYEEEKVYAAVKAAVSALGGLGRIVKQDEKILVKPNYLYPAKAEKCITTNPAVIKAFARLLAENGYGNVKIGDSPANGNCRQAFAQLGLAEEDLYGAVIADMNEEVQVDFPFGKAAKSFAFCKELTEADAIIGLCKMKTHALERITGAVKNMYGLICGKKKALGHVNFPNAASFAQMMADMHRCVKPRLHIMDGIVAMEGNGPASGTPVEMGVILASEDAVALDSVFARLVNLDPALVPTNTMGMASGIGTCRESEIEVMLLEEGILKNISMDELFRRFGKADFKVQREKEKFSILSLWSRITGGFAKKPVIDPEKCVKCGVCVDHCPVDGRAVSFKNGKENVPVYDYNKCIRCFCCQEICPQHAIGVK